MNCFKKIFGFVTPMRCLAASSKVGFSLALMLLFAFSACTDYEAQIDDEYEEWLGQNDSENKSSSKDIVSSSSKAIDSSSAATVTEVYEGNQRFFDIVIRDFSVIHPDFENFQEEAYNSLVNGGKNNVGAIGTWTYYGYEQTSDWFQRRGNYDNFGCGNTQTPQYGIAVGVNGYPHDIQSASGHVSTTPDYVRSVIDQTGYAWYGEFKDCQYDTKWNPLSLKVMRGLVSDLCSDASDSWAANLADDKKSCSGPKVCKTHSWSQIVYITPGMVDQKLVFPPDPSTGDLDMYEPVIARTPLRPLACDNTNFEQWYADVPGVNMRTNAAMILDQDPAEPSYFEIDRNWNNGGYFPLDSVDEKGLRVLNIANSVVFPIGKTNQYGPQSLSIFCPPYKYRWADSQTDYLGENTAALCDAWKNNGGPKKNDAAVTAALSSGTIGLRHLRNYGFTVMGYAKFKYKKGQKEVFKFTGDDDMWIFVDGVLVVDLGGTHLAAPGTVDMDYLSQNGHGCHVGDPLIDSCAAKLDADGSWSNDSWHHLHFFYADRQSDGSNLHIRSSLSELAAPRYARLEK